MPDIRASVLFCDDVRHEINGLVSVLGLYRGFLGMVGDGAVLPKLVALLLLEYSRDCAGTTVDIRLSDRDLSIAEAKFELPATPQIEAAALAGVPDRLFANVPIELVGIAPPVGAQLVVAVTAPEFRFVCDPLYVIRAPLTL